METRKLPNQLGSLHVIKALTEREQMEIETGKRGRPSLYYTAKDVAEIFEISEKTVYKHQQEYHARRRGGCVRFPKSIIHRMVEEDSIGAF